MTKEEDRGTGREAQSEAKAGGWGRGGLGRARENTPTAFLFGPASVGMC